MFKKHHEILLITSVNLLLLIGFILAIKPCYAGTPVWSLQPLTATTITVATNGSATVQYKVTNQSKKSHTLIMTNIPGITQDTSLGLCANPFILDYQQSCTLTLRIDGSSLKGNVVGGPQICQEGNHLQCYQPNTADALDISLIPVTLPTLSPNVSTLGLSVNNTSLNAALTGRPRQIIITNTSSTPAVDVTYSVSPSLPSGTTISPSNCGTIAASGTCTLTITPGSTPSATPGNTSPTPISLSISGTNTNTITPTLNIVTYGSVYQGGYVYSIDDTTSNTGSIGGKVAALTDQSSGVVWSSNSSGSYDGGVTIYGISELSTTGSPNPNTNQQSGQTSCNGKTDGSCDNNNIYVYYENFATGHPINTAYYAAGLCKTTINGYSDWYLPGICELGYGVILSYVNCGTSSSPLLQNILSNLVLNGNIGGFIGYYWSPTEWAQQPDMFAYSIDFTGHTLYYGSKDYTHAVRCSRALTI